MFPLLGGILIGVIVVLCILAAVYFKAQAKLAVGQVEKLAEDLNTTRAAFGRCVEIEQQREKLKQGIVFNFTEEQITTLANKVCNRVQIIMDAKEKAELNHLN